MTKSITHHYSSNLQATELLNNLAERYPEGPTAYQLAPIDQLHIGGIKASEKLLHRLEEMKPKRILEIGSGLGGLMRLINNRWDCTLMGIDITHRFNHLSQQLTRLSSHNKAATTLTADAQQLPFADGSFDCIILQHSLLNIPDTATCLEECQRVLKQNGSLLLHEVVEGPKHSQMKYPVPWAQAAEHSHLVTMELLKSQLQENDFTITSADNWSEEALQWRQRQAAKEQNVKQESIISPAYILGKEFQQMGQNVMANLDSGAVEIWEIVVKTDS